MHAVGLEVRRAGLVLLLLFVPLVGLVGGWLSLSEHGEYGGGWGLLCEGREGLVLVGGYFGIGIGGGWCCWLFVHCEEGVEVERGGVVGYGVLLRDCAECAERVGKVEIATLESLLANHEIEKLANNAPD